MDSNDLLIELAAGTVLAVSHNGSPVACYVELLEPCSVAVNGVQSKQVFAELLLGNARDVYRVNKENLEDE